MRLITLAATLICLALPVQAEDLRSAFYALPKAERKELQVRLSELGLYSGVIDGLWGPGTSGAFDQVRQSLAWPAHRQTAAEAGVTAPSEALWTFVEDPDLAASLPSWRRN